MSWENATDLGESTDIGAVGAVLEVAGLLVADVGCGPALAARELIQAGARVLAIEPDPIQAEKNRAAEPVAGLTFREAGAEALPAATASLDAVFFFRSLHHVPVALMDGALREAARVLKPGTGVLCVIEPGMTGSNFALMRPFHDETLVRTAAQAALTRTAAPLFKSETRYRYLQRPRHASFSAMVERVMGQTFNTIARERVESEGVRQLFEAGRTPEGDYVFEQPMLMAVYQGPGSR